MVDCAAGSLPSACSAPSVSVDVTGAGDELPLAAAEAPKEKTGGFGALVAVPLAAGGAPKLKLGTGLLAPAPPAAVSAGFPNEKPEVAGAPNENGAGFVADEASPAAAAGG